MHIPNGVLDIGNPKGDARLFHLMNIQCRSLRPDSASGLGFADQVRRHIRLHIAEANLSLETIAPYFGMSERTFQRRLAEAGLTLNDLRDAERRDLCYRLGYSAPSAFTRSVIRWFGVSPRMLRQQKTG
jgi:AraC-like DNA-binding protein